MDGVSSSSWNYIIEQLGLDDQLMVPGWLVGDVAYLECVDTLALFIELVPQIHFIMIFIYNIIELDF